MSVIKQISVYDGSTWGTEDIGADAGNILLSSNIAGSTNLQTALGNILPAKQLTANQVLIADSNKKLATNGVSADFLAGLANAGVSSTQFSYLDGVTSGIQTQINTINSNLAIKLPLMNIYSQDGSGFDKNFLAIGLTNIEVTNMRRSGWSWFSDTERAAFTNIPTLLASASSAAGIRQVYFINPNQYQVRVIENYPQHGRIHINAYRNGTWTGWRTVNPGYAYQPIGVGYQNGTVTIPSGVSGEKTATINFQNNVVPSGATVFGVSCLLSYNVLPYLNATNHNVVTWVKTISNSNLVIANLTTEWTNYNYYLTIFYFKA